MCCILSHELRYRPSSLKAFIKVQLRQFLNKQFYLLLREGKYVVKILHKTTRISTNFTTAPSEFWWKGDKSAVDAHSLCN